MKFTNIKVGEVLSSTIYPTVVAIEADGIKVKNGAGKEYMIKGPKFIEESMASASQFEKEEKISRTEAAQILISAGDSVFTVVFDKDDGTERTLVGKLVETENLMGRSNVIDLQIVGGHNMRQVNHRGLKSLILKGIKYTVKK